LVQTLFSLPASFDSNALGKQLSVLLGIAPQAVTASVLSAAVSTVLQLSLLPGLESAKQQADLTSAVRAAVGCASCTVNVTLATARRRLLAASAAVAVSNLPSFSAALGAGAALRAGALGAPGVNVTAVAAPQYAATLSLTVVGALSGNASALLDSPGSFFAAALAALTPPPPPPSPPPSPPPPAAPAAATPVSAPSAPNPSAATIAGAVVGSVCGLALISCLVGFCSGGVKKKAKKKAAAFELSWEKKKSGLGAMLSRLAGGAKAPAERGRGGVTRAQGIFAVAGGAGTSRADALRELAAKGVRPGLSREEEEEEEEEPPRRRKQRDSGGSLRAKLLRPEPAEEPEEEEEDWAAAAAAEAAAEAEAAEAEAAADRRRLRERKRAERAAREAEENSAEALAEKARRRERRKAKQAAAAAAAAAEAEAEAAEAAEAEAEAEAAVAASGEKKKKKKKKKRTSVEEEATEELAGPHAEALAAALGMAPPKRRLSGQH